MDPSGRKISVGKLATSVGEILIAELESKTVDVTTSPGGSDVTTSPGGSDVTKSPGGSDVTKSPGGSDDSGRRRFDGDGVTLIAMDSTLAVSGEVAVGSGVVRADTESSGVGAMNGKRRFEGVGARVGRVMTSAEDSGLTNSLAMGSDTALEAVGASRCGVGIGLAWTVGRGVSAAVLVMGLNNKSVSSAVEPASEAVTWGEAVRSLASETDSLAAVMNDGVCENVGVGDSINKGRVVLRMMLSF